jgi:hypothetical protein
MKHILVEIPVDGEWPSSQDLDARNAVIDELEQLRLGENTGAGGGMGSMDFSLRVADESRARQAIEAAMSKYLPNRQFTLDVSDDEDDGGDGGDESESPAADGIPTSRSYVHDKCGQSTVVSGGDFKNLACPVPGMGRTMCVSCGGAFPVSEFKWEDSNEGIEAYYKRHRARISAFIRLLCSRQITLVAALIGFIAGIGVGVWSGNALGLLWGIVIGVVSALVGPIASILIWDAITTPLLNRDLGVRDVRLLQ